MSVLFKVYSDSSFGRLIDTKKYGILSTRMQISYGESDQSEERCRMSRTRRFCGWGWDVGWPITDYPRKQKQSQSYLKHFVLQIIFEIMPFTSTFDLILYFHTFSSDILRSIRGSCISKCCASHGCASHGFTSHGDVVQVSAVARSRRGGWLVSTHT